MTAVDPHKVDDRTAMGLAPGMTSRIDPAALAGAIRSLVGRDAEALLAAQRDPASDLTTRYAAGTLLGLIGDPRIRPFDPPMVSVPAADVLMGTGVDAAAAVAEQWADVGVRVEWLTKESPRHRRRVEAFRIAVHPVTNAEYALYLADTQAPPPSSWRWGVYPVELANHPVWTVRPEDADGYAAWLSVRTGRSFRLPTEAEWEYAASGGDGRQFPWGEWFLPDHANTVDHGPAHTTPIGSYPLGRSPLGCEDIAGNVEEYTADDYTPYPGGDHVRDDLVTAQGGYRVTRGGSFTRYGDLARCARRHGWYPRDIYAVGFRLAESVTP